MELGETRSTETLWKLLHIHCTIVPIVLWYSISRLITQLFATTHQRDCLIRYILEFIVIIIPTVVSVNVLNTKVELIVIWSVICVVLVVWRKRCIEKAKHREFEWARRPYLFSLMRTTINLLTSLCILAIDFESFPKKFRKSRYFGAGLMDVGIGLFVYSMGLVSRRPRRLTDLFRLIRVVIPILGLGFARTISIRFINYHQDEHEYGVHCNAFFILGIVKLLATLISAITRSDKHLLLLGIVILVIHEFGLQMGVGNYVMADDVPRNNIWAANREGLSSIPGFVALFLISMFLGKWMKCEEGALTFKDIIRRIKNLVITASGLGLLLLNCVYTMGIARVTCNFGYVVWMLCIATTMMSLFLIFFDFILNTLWPIDTLLIGDIGIGCKRNNPTELILELPEVEKSTTRPFVIPTIIEAINLNGLLMFLLANLLTGAVNIFLNPHKCSDLQSILILTLYMFICIGSVYILYRMKIRIA